MVQQVVESNQPAAELRGVKLSYDCQQDLPRVFGKLNQLRRVIVNLASNAVQHNSDGEITVRLYEQRQQLIIEVEDIGMGIDEDDLPYIFDHFFSDRRVRQTVLRVTGIGLAIEKEIVDIHQSAINVSSEVGTGSCFWGEFPIWNSYEA